MVRCFILHRLILFHIAPEVGFENNFVIGSLCDKAMQVGNTISHVSQIFVFLHTVFEPILIQC